MKNIREILRLKSQGISERNIASSLKCSRNTVSKVLLRANELNIRWPLEVDYTNGELEELLFPKESAPVSTHRPPNVEYIHSEMKKPSVNLRLLWVEYCETCKQSKELPLMYSQFCNVYQKYARRKRATMHIPRKPAEAIEVDWAGQTAYIYDRETGEEIDVYLFVGVLSYSLYAYAEAFYDQSKVSWINAHINMYNFYGGSTRILIPDNLKTGVTKPDTYDPVINKTYAEMAEYYNAAVLPARVRRPKDKPGVEGVVGNVSTWILAALRNEKFFSLGELNQAIKEKLNKFNHNPFQKKDGSRFSYYLEEKDMLIPLPKAPYELAEWKKAKVQYNYHISINRMNYSVPCEYIGYEVDVKITSRVIEVFYKNHRLTTHPLLYGRPGQYHTIEEHMPAKHQEYNKWDANRFIKWAATIGPNTAIVIKCILESHKIEQQAYKSCMGLIKLSEKHTIPRLEAACTRALTYTSSPSYKSVKTILATGQDKVDDQPVQTKQTAPEHSFTRGARFYGGK